MSQKIAVIGRDDYIEECKVVNRRVSEAVKKATEINPRTKIAGYSSNTFTVDTTSGEIYVIKVKPEVLEGYLAHENGHRSLFPASTAGSIALISAVGALSPNASQQDVVAASNVVADAFSDTMLHYSGLGKILSKRVPDFISRVKSLDALMAFKVLIYKAIEKASYEGRSNITVEDLSIVLSDVKKLYPAYRELLNDVFDIAKKFVMQSDKLLSFEKPSNIAKFLLNPFTVSIAPYIAFLAEIAVELLWINKNGNTSDSGGMQSGSDETDQKHRQTPSQRSDGSSSEGRSKSLMLSKQEGRDVEGNDIEPTVVDPSDVQKAMMIMHRGFGMDVYVSAASIERLFSDKIRKGVLKFIEKIKVLYAQSDKKTYKPAGFRKEMTDLWLHPLGEPDEDSILKEKHKLLWKVEYKVPNPKGRMDLTPANVPEKLVLVIDESGSTMNEFGQSNIISVEALISMLVAAGLRYRGGAKETTVIKFSDGVAKVYSGKDTVEACTRVLLPHQYAGGGTNIVKAVDVGLNEATKNSALVITTDLEISNDVAELIGKKLKHASDRGAIGFTVFVVVNQNKNEEVLNIIRKYLTNRNAIVAHVSNVDDLENLGNTVISRVLQMR